VQTTEAVFSSPPYWMTVSGCTNGHSEGAQSNIPTDRVDDFADYMAEVTEHFATTDDPETPAIEGFGMPFDSVAPMNEPFDSWWDKDEARQSGTHVTSAQQDELIRELKESLTARSLNTGISASDANHTEDALSAFQGYSQAARDALTQVNTHTYHYTDPQGNFSSLTPLHNEVARAGKNLWMSEYGTSGYAYAYRNEVAGALNLGTRITHDLNALRPDGWVLWDGIESLRENRDSYDGVGQTWGLIYADYEAPRGRDLVQGQAVLRHEAVQPLPRTRRTSSPAAMPTPLPASTPTPGSPCWS